MQSINLKYFKTVFLSVLFSFTFSQDVTLNLDGSELNYESSVDIAGFQFSHNGCVTGAAGGDAAANGFTVSASGSTVLAFSFTGSVIPAGTGTLVELSGGVSEDCLSEFIFSDAEGNSLDVGLGSGSADDGGMMVQMMELMMVVLSVIQMYVYHSMVMI